MDALLNYRYSFMAGACAAGGSFFGKLPSFFSARQLLQVTSAGLTTNYIHHMELCLYRVIPLVLMVICNIFNWRYFLKALQLTQHTLTATVLTAASNYVLSFILGALVYQEPLTVLSGIGTTFILAGLWFLCDTQTKQQETIIKAKKEL